MTSSDNIDDAMASYMNTLALSAVCDRFVEDLYPASWRTVLSFLKGESDHSSEKRKSYEEMSERRNEPQFQSTNLPIVDWGNYSAPTILAVVPDNDMRIIDFRNLVVESNQSENDLSDAELLEVESNQSENDLSDDEDFDEKVTDDTKILSCKICMTNKICVALVKCGHTFCNSCTKKFNHQCAQCRTTFDRLTKIKIFV